MNEGEFVRKLKDELNKHEGVKAMKLNTGPNGRRGEPDLLGCVDGHMFAIEVKLDYNKPTELQKQRIAEWRSAGATAGVITHYEGISIPDTVNHLLAQARAGLRLYVQPRALY